MCNAPVFARPRSVKVDSSLSLRSSSSSSSSFPPETMSMPQHHRFGGIAVDSPPKGKGGVIKAFPIKLHDMLDAADDGAELEINGVLVVLSSIVSWQPHGRCFVVRDHKRFTVEVMPKYFRQTKFASFQRQLNLYGFQRFTQGRDKNGYYNEYFLRGQRHLTNSMTRMKVKGTRVRQATRPDAQPNFYSMPPIPRMRRGVSSISQPRPEQVLSSNPGDSGGSEPLTTSKSDSPKVTSETGSEQAAGNVTPPLRPLPAPVGLPGIVPLAPLANNEAAPARGPALITPPVRRMSIGRPAAPRPPAPPLTAVPVPSPSPSASTYSSSPSMTPSSSHVSLSSVDTDSNPSSSSSGQPLCPLLPKDPSNMCRQTVDFLRGLYEIESAQPWSTPPPEPRPQTPIPAWPKLEEPAPMAVEASMSSEGDLCYFAGMPFHYIEDLKETDV